MKFYKDVLIFFKKNMNILITGGSGFIGTNVVEYYVKLGHEVLNLDIKMPLNKDYFSNWQDCDIRNFEDYANKTNDFNPDYFIHLAARTDLDETQNINGYDSNILGFENTIKITNKLQNLKKVIFVSSRLVNSIYYRPKTVSDYNPPNLYGESKMLGEKLVLNLATSNWIIVRPTSIWGPWFHIPYKTFFDTIKKGYYFLPKNNNPKKSFGFVLNSVFQLDKLLFCSDKYSKNIYYLTDYPFIELENWANMISLKMKNKKVRKINNSIVKLIAKMGDVLIKLGFKRFPLTTFRYNNMITDMVYNTKEMEEICGSLPYSLKEGVDITVNWMKK